MKSVQPVADETANQPRPAPTLPVPLIPDHELLRRIGTGSYGEVWLARTLVGTLRAIKVVYRRTFEQRQQFDREFNGLQKFEPISRSHEGLVDILQLGRNDAGGYFYYVMELADDGAVSSFEFEVSSSETPGDRHQPETRNPKPETNVRQPETPNPKPETYIPKTLRAEQRRLGRIPVNECLDIALALTDALAHLHAHGLVHRDIKPSNIILVNGKPKLADIGLVADMSEARSFVGTMGFIPAEGPGKAQADLYSLGKVLYEISTGKDRQEFPALPSNLRELPDHDALIEFNEIVLKACDDDVGQRYATAQALHGDLALLQRGQSVIRKHTRAHRLKVASRIGLVTAAIAVLVASGWLLSRVLNPSSDSTIRRSDVLNISAPVESKVIAVLPFENESTNKTDEFLGSQIAEEISSALTRIPELRVLGHDSTEALRTQKDNRRAMVENLNVIAMVQGRVRKAGDRLQLTVEMIEPRGGHRLWSERYDRPFRELLGIQADTLEGITRALAIKRGDLLLKHLATQSTRNFEAYHLYLQGRFLSTKQNGKEVEKAVGLLEKSIALDSNSAPAQAELAFAYAILNDYTGIPARECLPKAKAAALRALELDESLPEAHIARATVAQQWEWDWPAAEAGFKRALELSPNLGSAHGNYAWFLMPMGRTQEAIAEAARALELDPYSVPSMVVLAVMHYWAGRYEEAVKHFKRAIALEPRSPQAYNELAFAYERLGRFDEAVAVKLESMRLNGMDKDVAALREAYDKEGLQRFFEKELELCLLQPRFRPDAAAQFCVRLGRNEEAIDWLEKTVEDRGFWSLMLMRDPLFRPLHSHPRFVALVKKVGLPDYGSKTAR